MKELISSILLITWMSFVGMSSNMAALHSLEEADETTSCHSSNQKNEEKDCCTKLHKESNEEKSGGTHDEDAKGCCSENNCPRICCHIQMAYTQDTDHDQKYAGSSNTSHNLYPSTHLPSPYMEHNYPPPNPI